MKARSSFFEAPATLAPWLLLLTFGCGGSRVLWEDAHDGPAEVKIDPWTTFQTLEGFGASAAWYGEWFIQHPNRDALEPILFRDLGFDILRLRNQHRTPGDQPDPAGLAIYARATASLGHPPRVLLSSWSPPAALKASGRTDCIQGDTNESCTLLPNADGSFDYDAFGRYWLESLEAYRAEGLEPHYVSIQNEPDFKPTGWEGCLFLETERDGLPGYDRALDAVWRQLNDANQPARLIGAETAHLASGAVGRYASELDTAQLYGLAHHLYDGSTWQSPDSFGLAMEAVAKEYPSLPAFQTEFAPSVDGQDTQGGFEIAWLIHNSIALEHASAYLHWELFWPNGGLVAISNPWDRSKWTTPEGFVIREPYYSLRHYARYTDPGDRVVDARSTKASILSTGFLSVDESRLTVVLLNTAATAQSVSLDLAGFEFLSSIVVSTTAAAPWQPGPSLDPASEHALVLEPRSIVTVVVSNSATPLE